jgi:hypothetical protein
MGLPVLLGARVGLPDPQQAPGASAPKTTGEQLAWAGPAAEPSNFAADQATMNEQHQAPVKAQLKGLGSLKSKLNWRAGSAAEYNCAAQALGSLQQQDFELAPPRMARAGTP